MLAQTAVLTEIERQQEHLSRLPKGFQFPLFNYKVALESQRKSAYKTTAAAAREIVDNAIEAGANHIEIIFQQRRAQSGQGLVDGVAFIDDGPGMLPDMIRYALCWGGGTHYDHPDHIGRFGFGLPNSSINQTRLVEVYSRTAADEPIYKSRLDLDKVADYGLESVPEPIHADLPSFVQRHLDRTRRKFDHGVIVVWLDPDRLTYKRPARLKEHLLDDFGVVYRYFLLKADTPLQLAVEGVSVLPVHPLFMEPGARYYESPSSDVESATGGGARRVGTWFIPVKYWADQNTGEWHLSRLEHEEDANPTDETLAVGTIHVQIARLPVGFVQGSKKENPDAYRRHEIRRSRRGISFVRADREIETLDILPKSSEDKAHGMGDWPLLQTFAYHWGIEVKFNPALDDLFGITNDKQGVRPIEDFWRILTAEGIDAAARHENRWQEIKRKEIKNQTDKEKEESTRNLELPSPAEASMQDADVASSDRPDIPEQHKDSAKNNFEFRVRERSRIAGETIDEARVGVRKSLENRKYGIEFFESAHGPFYEPAWVGDTIFVRINTQHPFYGILYEYLRGLPGGERAKQAIDVLLLALGRSELTSGDADMTEWYRAQRERRWSPSLEDALRSLTGRIPENQEEEELEGV